MASNKYSHRDIEVNSSAVTIEDNSGWNTTGVPKDSFICLLDKTIASILVNLDVGTGVSRGRFITNKSLSDSLRVKSISWVSNLVQINFTTYYNNIPVNEGVTHSSEQNATKFSKSKFEFEYTGMLNDKVIDLDMHDASPYYMLESEIQGLGEMLLDRLNRDGLQEIFSTHWGHRFLNLRFLCDYFESLGNYNSAFEAKKYINYIFGVFTRLIEEDMVYHTYNSVSHNNNW